jgi:hypothetical protein
MKGFGIEIKNDLLEPKHVKQMGTAVWLYMWLIDKLTSIREEGVGVVLGGRPVKYEEIARELGISQDTYTRWIEKLLEYPYIAAVRTPHGISFRVFKAHKRFGSSQISARHDSQLTNRAEGDSAKSRSDSAEVRRRFRGSAESNLRQNKDNTRTDNSIDHFELFWEVYPRKVAKKKALQIWRRISPAPSLVEKIMSALKLARESDQWRKDDGRFIPHPTTWLNQERWNDEIRVPVKGPSKYDNIHTIEA